MSPVAFDTLGKRYEPRDAEVDATRGYPENATSYKEIVKKFHRTSTDAIEDKQAKLIVDIVSELEQLENLQKLIELLKCS